MSTKTLEDILQELRKPFHPAEVYWKPGMVNSDKTKALAMPYASLRAYQNRLDEVCGAEWSVTYTPWGKRLVCHLTISGVTRSSTGEPDSQQERSEIAGTSAEAQAFKRACSAFALGRYLYSLPTVWVDYDAQARAFTAQAKARLEGIVVLHYQRALQPETAEESSTSLEDEATVAREQDEALTALRQQFAQLGSELYGDQWPQVRRHNVERITAGQSSDADELTLEQLQKLIDGMKQVKRKRRSARARQQAKTAS
jgi:hypothetical protein